MKKSDDVFFWFEVIPFCLDWLFLLFSLKNGFKRLLFVWFLEAAVGWILFINFRRSCDRFDFVIKSWRFGGKRRLLRRGVISFGVSHGFVFRSHRRIVVFLLKRSQIDVVFLEYFRVLTLNLRKSNVLFFKQIILQILNLLHKQLILLDPLLSS